VLLDSAKVDKESIAKLKSLIVEHKGNIPIRIKLYDRDENKTIELKARTAKVEPSGFLKALELEGGINYKLN
jgi:hypothetical protein